MVRLDLLLSTTLLLGAAGISAASFDQETAFYERSIDATQQFDSRLQARREALSFNSPVMRRKAPAPAPKKEAPKKEAPKKAAAPAAAPKTVNKTTVTNTNINKSTTNNANMSGNQGTLVNSGNTIAHQTNVAKQDNCNVSVNKRDLLPRDANSDWLNAGMNYQLQQQKLQTETVQAMNNKCVCNCKRSASQLLGADGFEDATERRAYGGVSISDPSALVVRASLEPRCSIKQETATGRHVWSGACARSTLGGFPLTQLLEQEQ